MTSSGFAAAPVPCERCSSAVQPGQEHGRRRRWGRRTAAVPQVALLQRGHLFPKRGGIDARRGHVQHHCECVRRHGGVSR